MEEWTGTAQTGVATDTITIGRAQRGGAAWIAVTFARRKYRRRPIEPPDPSLPPDRRLGQNLEARRLAIHTGRSMLQGSPAASEVVRLRHNRSRFASLPQRVFPDLRP